MISVQEYINKNYKDKTIKVLSVSNKNLEGNLDLSDFKSLERLDCSRNLITGLNLTNCSIIEFNCSDNNLASLDFLSALDKKKTRIPFSLQQ